MDAYANDVRILLFSLALLLLEVGCRTMLPKKKRRNGTQHVDAMSVDGEGKLKRLPAALAECVDAAAVCS